MIPLTRDRTQVHNQFTGTQLVTSSLNLLEQQRDKLRGNQSKHKFQTSLWGKAKPQLLKESNNKCAYCESPLAVVAYGDVEHYRPKSRYWWLAYCLDNYLVSCAICNQKFKSNHFPKKNGKLSAPRVRQNSKNSTLRTMAKTIAPDAASQSSVNAFTLRAKQEGAWLLNPYVDNPSAHFAWHADLIIQEVELIPANQSPDTQQIVNEAKTRYGLDRSQLRRSRFNTFLSYYGLKLSLQNPATPNSLKQQQQNLIQIMLQDQYPYAGMIRFFENSGTTIDWLNLGLLTT